MSSTDGQGLTWNATSADSNSTGRIVNTTIASFSPLPVLRARGSVMAALSGRLHGRPPRTPHDIARKTPDQKADDAPTREIVMFRLRAAPTSPDRNISDPAAAAPS